MPKRRHSSPSRPRPEKAAHLRATYRRLIEAVYLRWNPEKVVDVPRLMDKYAGQEPDIYDKVVRRYVSGAAWRPLLKMMYERFNPEKLEGLDRICEKYAESEAALYKALCDKYLPTLSERGERARPLQVDVWGPPADEGAPARRQEPEQPARRRGGGASPARSADGHGPLGAGAEAPSASRGASRPRSRTPRRAASVTPPPLMTAGSGEAHRGAAATGPPAQAEVERKPRRKRKSKPPKAAAEPSGANEENSPERRPEASSLPGTRAKAAPLRPERQAASPGLSQSPAGAAPPPPQEGPPGPPAAPRARTPKVVRRAAKAARKAARELKRAMAAAGASGDEAAPAEEATEAAAGGEAPAAVEAPQPGATAAAAAGAGEPAEVRPGGPAPEAPAGSKPKVEVSLGAEKIADLKRRMQELRSKKQAHTALDAAMAVGKQARSAEPPAAPPPKAADASGLSLEAQMRQRALRALGLA